MKIKIQKGKIKDKYIKTRNNKTTLLVAFLWFCVFVFYLFFFIFYLSLPQQSGPRLILEFLR